MGSRWDDEWQKNPSVYTEQQLESVIDELGLVIESETENSFLLYCPFHDNTDSPALAINKENGLWFCFNPSCANRGNFISFVMKVSEKSYMSALRIIKKYEVSFFDRPRIKKIEKFEFKEFPQETILRLKHEFWLSKDAQRYMHGRGLGQGTLENFDIGFSKKKNMVTIPMHCPNGLPIGMIGRSIEGKIFNNTKNLPKSRTLWNFNRAKKYGSQLIIVEAAIDAMKITQAGHKNVVATLGGSFSDYHAEQVARVFDSVIIMTDFDHKIFKEKCLKCEDECKGHRPGRDLGREISSKLPGKKILWAAYNEECIFPRGQKDPGGLAASEISQCIRNSMSTYKYNKANLEFTDA